MSALRNAVRLLAYAGTRRANPGRCPVCGRATLFIMYGPWLRDHYLCARCNSIPRQRALMLVLEREFPDWRSLRIHESSPGGASSDRIRAQCPGYKATQFYPDVPPGASKDGFRCENLERMTFQDASFDLVITQDVFEHVLAPEDALREIARTLKPGGAHLFTMPYYAGRATRVRARHGADGVELLAEPEYHGNPIDSRGSLVTREWGADFPDFVRRHSGMETTIYRERGRNRGLDGEFLEVFVSRKPDVAQTPERREDKAVV